MMLFKLITSCLVALVPLVASADSYGWTTSGLENNQTITDCLESKNSAQFILFNGMYYDDVRPEICDELSNAMKSNIAHREVSFSPCPTCKASAASQIDKLVTHLKTKCASNTWSGRLWLDMKSYGYWPSPWRDIGYVSNQKWYNEMVDACLATPDISCGMYAAPDKYKYIVGSNDYVYPPATTLPLWYTSANGVASFDDFVSFGGFTKPYAKEYQMLAYGTCGTPYLYEDWAPEW